MPRLNDEHVRAHFCRTCDFYQKPTMWCMRFSCIENVPGGVKDARHARATSATSAISAAEHQRRMELYNRGLSDAMIGKAVGLKASGIQCWRKRNGLKRNEHITKNMLPPEEEARREKAFRTFSSDKKAAEMCGITRVAFEKWRVSRGLRRKPK